MVSIDVNEILEEALEKTAFIPMRSWWRTMPGMKRLSERALLNRIAQTYGPHATQGLKNVPHELSSLNRLLAGIPSGGTAAGVDASAVAPTFTQAVLKGKSISGEMLNRLLPASKRAPVVSPQQPDSIFGMLGQTAKRHPVGTLAAGGLLGTAALKLLKKDNNSGNSSRGPVVIT